jgi:hypothetical protein
MGAEVLWRINLPQPKNHLHQGVIDLRKRFTVFVAVALLCSLVLVLPAVGATNGKIAFTSMSGANNEIYVMDADGTNQIDLTNNPSGDWCAAWSPDGMKIAFTSDRNENSEIYVMDANGDNQIDLTNNPAADGCPSWSPDGMKIAFSSGRFGDIEIYVMNANGGIPIDISNNPAMDTTPSWSPDGTKIAFDSDRLGASGLYESAIWVMDANGDNPTQLTDNPTTDYDPAWGIAVQTPEQEINDLKTAVEELNLKNGKGYIAKLDEALNSLAKGNTHAAINQLNAFINLANAQQGKKLTKADELIAQAQEIIDSI